MPSDYKKKFRYYRNSSEFLERDPALVALWSNDLLDSVVSQVKNRYRDRSRNLLLDGDMEANNVSSWAAGASATLTKDTGAPHSGTRNLRIARNGVDNPNAQQSILVTGKTYRIIGWYKSDGTALPRINSGVTLITGTNSTSWTFFDITFVAGGSALIFSSITNSGTTYTEWDDVQVFQLNIVSFPEINPQLLADNDMEQSGVGAWTARSSAALTKEVAAPFAGTQSLRVTRTTLNNPYAEQAILVVGRTYRITGRMKGDGTFAPSVRHGGNVIFTGAVTASWEYFEATFTAAASDLRLVAVATSTGGFAEFDDLELFENNVPYSVLTNGSAEYGNTDGWTASNATLSAQTGTPIHGSHVLRIVRDGGGASASQNVLIVGKRYKVRGYARGDGTNSPSIIASGSVWAGTSSSSWQRIEASFVATSVNFTLVSGGTVSNYVEFDGVEVILDVPNAPVNLLSDASMEMAGVTMWDNVGSTVTKQTGTPFSGTQVLRIAYNSVVSPRVRQTILTAGKRYRIFGYARSNGVGIPIILTEQALFTIWQGTTSTNWQYFEASFVSDDSRLALKNNVNSAGYVEFDQVTVIEDTVVLPGNRLQDGDMEASGVTWWAALNSATVTKETGTPFEGSQVIRVARNGVNNPAVRQIVLILGKRYRVKGRMRSDGSATPSIVLGGTTVAGSTSTNWQEVDFTAVATLDRLDLTVTTSTGTQYAEFDSITVEEIPPMTGTLSGAIAGVASGKPEVRGATFFDGSNDFINAYSTELNSVFNPSMLTFGIVYRLPPSALTDGSVRQMFRLSSDSSNEVLIFKSNTDNQIIVRYRVGGTATSIAITVAADNRWHSVSLTIDLTTSEMKAFHDGIQSGSTGSVTSPLTGNLATTNCAMGAASTSAGSPHSGWLAIGYVLDHPKPAEWHRDLAFRLGVT